MKRVFATAYLTLRKHWPTATCIRPVKGGFEGYVFTDPAPRTAQDNRYSQHTFMDKG